MSDDKSRVTDDASVRLEAPSRTGRVIDALGSTSAATTQLGKDLLEQGGDIAKAWAAKGGDIADDVDAPERLAAARDMLLRFVQRVSDSAQSTVDHVKWAILGMSALTLGSILHLSFIRDYHLMLAVLPFFLMVVPIAALYVCYRVLRPVAELPEHITESIDELTVASKKHWGEIADLEYKRLGLIRKWKTYFLLAKVLRTALGTVDNGKQVMASLGLAMLVSNPIAWAVLAGAVIVSVLATFCLCFFLVLEAILGATF